MNFIYVSLLKFELEFSLSWKFQFSIGNFFAPNKITMSIILREQSSSIGVGLGARPEKDQLKFEKSSRSAANEFTLFQKTTAEKKF